ncbi:MAG: prepilin-type N-terminal cleavage/methylation domain-containing protein [Candidatus Paceibacterota bacterium]|jgi:prepilin-type N-terminal cleavage/methylation domain-containing protein
MEIKIFSKMKGLFSPKNFSKQTPSNNGKGFTLIEMLVAIGIFSVLIVVLSGIFLSSMKSQTHIIYTQYLVDNTNSALDSISRYLRMAQKDFDPAGACAGIKNNFNPFDTSSSTITFLDYKGFCHQFLLEDGKIKEKVSEDNTANFGEAQDLTSDKIKVTNLKFNVLGGANGDNLQPRITILIGAEANTNSLNPLPKINVQTTISQRNLDKEI